MATFILLLTLYLLRKHLIGFVVVHRSSLNHGKRKEPLIMYNILLLLENCSNVKCFQCTVESHYNKLQGTP